MARIITSVKDFETWLSAIDGIVWLKKFDRRGDTIEEPVKPHSKVILTPEERRYNQEQVAEASLDPFLNGMLVPLQLVESADDYDELRGNPNHLTEQDMRAMLDDHKALDKLRSDVSKVTNPSTLQRMLAIAEDEDVDATIRQVKVVRERLAEVSSEAVYTEVEQFTSSDGREMVGTAAPQSPAPRRKSMGRR